MDVVLDLCDTYAFDSVYASAHTPAVLRHLPRESILRQSVSLYAITLVGILSLYFITAGGSYAFLYDKRLKRHPRYLKGQISKEIKMSLQAFWVLDFLTLPWFMGEVRGSSKLYASIHDSPFGQGVLRGSAYIVLSSIFFLWFTDLCIYFVHRWEHIPWIYKHIHKPHHRWIIPTPFASHAFHPLDGYAQSLPYHIFVYLFPLHRYTYLGLFVFVNFWTIAIHDADMISGHPLESIINGPAHHTLHHMYFTCNYGQYFTWADKWGGSYRTPRPQDDPVLTVLERDEKLRLQQASSSSLSSTSTPTVTTNSIDSASSSSDEDDASSLDGVTTPSDSLLNTPGEEANEFLHSAAAISSAAASQSSAAKMSLYSSTTSRRQNSSRKVQ